MSYFVLYRLLIYVRCSGSINSVGRGCYQLLVVTSSRKHLRTKVTPALHLKYSKNKGNLGLILNDNFFKISP